MKIQLFSLSGLWCGLQKFLWPFSFFWDSWCLRSPVVCKKFYFWTGFHHKKLTNQKSHSTSLWTGRRYNCNFFKLGRIFFFQTGKTFSFQAGNSRTFPTSKMSFLSFLASQKLLWQREEDTSNFSKLESLFFPDWKGFVFPYWKLQILSNFKKEPSFLPSFAKAALTTGRRNM